jgi:molybdopterin-guanine dinucleotide biosynthesis protein A
MTSIVLAGGKGKRLGRDKLSETVGGRSLLQRVVVILGLVSDQTLIVIAQGQSEPAVSAPTEVKIVTDLHPGKGALGGIYTGLASSDSFHNLVVAADMPFLNPSLLRYLMGLSADYDVVMPKVRGEIEPLHAVYSRHCLEPIRHQLEDDSLKIRDFLERVRVRYVEEAEIKEFDPNQLSFFNVNTPADLRRAQSLLEEVGGQ